MKRAFVWLLLSALLLTAFACKAQPKNDASVPDGTYRIAVTLSGGTGRAWIESPALLTVKEGAMTLTAVWSSDKYDYMLVGGEKYLPEIIDGHSVFEIPVATLETPFQVIADTTAMSTPHEIEYTITFDPASLESAS